MASRICAADSLFDFEKVCIRVLWGIFVPLSITVALVLGAILRVLPYPSAFREWWRKFTAPFEEFITLEEAETFLASHEDANSTQGVEGKKWTPASHKPPVWKNALVSLASWSQVISWLALGIQGFLTETSDDGLGLLISVLLAVPWLYSAIRPIVRPFATAPYDIFALLLSQVYCTLFRFGGRWYEYGAFDRPLPGLIVMVIWGLNIVALIISFAVVLGMPLGLPGKSVDPATIGVKATPEDYTVLWKWLTFEWIYPFVRKGKNKTLRDEDVFRVSPTQQSRVVFHQFRGIIRSTLFHQLLAANSLDFILDFTITIASVFLAYCSPIFLRLILETIQSGTTRREAALGFVYAGLMFFTGILKAQLDVKHLWHSRRITTRMRSELMAALYDKALKRKDFSGVAQDRTLPGAGSSGLSKKGDEAKAKSGEDVKKGKQLTTDAGGDTKKDGHKKAGGGIGKIVQLMTGDASRIAETVGRLDFLYGAPFEITIAVTLLYNILGISAFAGILVLFLSFPANASLMKRSVNIQKGLLAARDKRMGVVSEVVSSVKFIKFFAWEEKWIERAERERKEELKWIVKARINSILLNTVWLSVPLFVSVFSFLSYVLLGHELTVAAAFTSISLFAMLRMPLNTLPSWIMILVQSKLSLDRLEAFFEEEEVDTKFSSLKQPSILPPRPADDSIAPLGIKNGSFGWNSVKQRHVDADEAQKNAERFILGGMFRRSKGKGKDGKKAVGGEEPPSNAHGQEELLAAEDVRFELRDIEVIFPEGKLSVVTGPTASGKTALLLALLGEMTLLPSSSPNSDADPSAPILLTKDPSKVSRHGYGQYVSYAAQSPWLQHSSIRDNILFGQPLDQERYEEVLEACALNPDLDILEDGDRTEIGARGVNLSGGQKARVALARAAYARSQYLLLDDPLSAVDSHTARKLYEKLLRGPLLANRTVVLVTHHVELVLPGAYYLVRMLDGRIDEQGLVEDLRKSGKLDHITHDADLQTQSEITAEKLQEPTADEIAVVTVKKNGLEMDGQEKKKPRKLIEDERRAEGAVKWSVYKAYVKASSYWIWALLLLLVGLREAMTVGEKFWIKVWGDAYNDQVSAVSLIARSFNSWLDESKTAGGSSQQFAYFNVPQSFGSSQGIVMNVGRGIGPLPVRTQDATIAQLPSVHRHPLFYVGVYTGIGLATMLISVAMNAAQLSGALRASRTLFSRLLDSVMFATIRFHDTTPAGRLLNRFSKDIETIDSSLASSLQSVNSTLGAFLFSLLTVSVISPGFFLAAIVIGYIYYWLGAMYLNTGRDLRRMESNNRSPVISGFSELIDGIVTVRAFSAERRFLSGVFKKIDDTISPWYIFWMTNRWLMLHYDLLSAFALLLTTTLSLVGGVDAGLAGIAITSAMNFTRLIYWTCRNWTQLELDLNSVERVVEYLELPRQPPSVIENSRPPAYWPSTTTKNDMIVVKDLVIRYAPDLPNVLHGVHFNLRGQERVGLLGRTGSGKSTLAMSILRFVDPIEGSITIDGINIADIGLYDLRSRLTFIPQDATLFSGTIRDNLDPFSEYSDEDCIDVLRRVRLINSRHASALASRKASRAHSPTHESRTSTAVGSSRTASGSARSTLTVVNERETLVDAREEKSTIDLETKVSTGGANFSQGQRQLIALARALLRQSSIIIMDEATSSIDFETDSKIQEAIREEFKNSLLLTIAHRLKTVIDYDRLLVLDQGRVVETGTPWDLIRKEGGFFREMCLKSGMFKELEDAAMTKTAQDG